MLSSPVVSGSLWPSGLWATRLLCPWGFPDKNTGAGCHFLLQGIFLTQRFELASLMSPALAGRFFTTSTTWKTPLYMFLQLNFWCHHFSPGPDFYALACNNLLESPSEFSSDAQSCPTLCNPMDCSTPGFPVHHQLPELAQTHVHRVGDAIQPSHPL